MRLATASLLAALALLASTSTRAAEYEVFIDVDTEEQLFDLLESGQISEDTFETLVDLLRAGIDLDTATRDELYELPNLTYDEVDAILLYRKESGRIRDPADLVAAGVISAAKLLAISPFLRVGSARPGAYATDGWVRAPMLYTPPSDALPAMGLLGRATTYKHWTVGGAFVVTRLRLGDVAYDPTRDALSAGAPSAQPHLPKLYVRYEKGGFSAIAGSYRIGFGQRLVFDNTSRQAPHGLVADDDLVRSSGLTSACKESQGELGESPCTGEAGAEYVGPDFRWREGLFGAAVGLRGLAAGPGQLSLHAFGSVAARPIYQYEIYDTETCDDPRNDADPGCTAPAVYKRQDDLLAPTSRFSFSTLPDMFRETTVGANVSFFTGNTTHVGATGYLASVDWLTEGIALDFQEYARYPRGGPFGAVGVDGAFRLRQTDVFLEVAHSFDSIPEDQGGGGGFGAILRSTATLGTQELEASARWYAAGFANPYARPIAAPDEYDGQRARDEAGVRVKYTASFSRRATLRAAADVWTSTSGDEDARAKALVYARGDWLATQQLGVGLWTEWQDKGLGDETAMPCYEVSFETDETGEPVDCTGQKLRFAVRARVMPSKRLTLALQYSHAVLDDADDRFAMTGGRRQDASAFFMASWKPTDALRLRARTRWLDDGLGQDDYLETSWWSYVELWWKADARLRARLRYDLYVWLDDRDATAERSPNPEHWLWLELESRF